MSGACVSQTTIHRVQNAEKGSAINRLRTPLNSGCGGHADFAHDIEKQFIDWTEITPWLTPTK